MDKASILNSDAALISCLMITQPARLAMATRAIGDFLVQTHAARELIIVHDGDDGFHAALMSIDTAGQAIRVIREASGKTLGALRNTAVSAASGKFICQWDDDDRHHPQRLALQWRTLVDAEAAFCFLSDQLHWFAARGEMFWDDWDREAYPFNLVQGTLLGLRERMPPYADLARGEDTALLIEILRRGDPIVRLRDAGWCYVYIYHGGNAFDGEHHQAIVRAKRRGGVALMQREGLLRDRLCDYRPGFGVVRLVHEHGCLEIPTDPV